MPGARQYGLTYSKFINALKVGNVKLDRKVLSDLAGMSQLLLKLHIAVPLLVYWFKTELTHTFKNRQ